jgi:hypothetical protein
MRQWINLVEQQLNELFTNHIDYEWFTDGYNRLNAKFILGDPKFGKEKIYYMLFCNSGEVIFYVDIPSENLKGSESITNTGDAPIVFSTLSFILDEYLTKYKPEEFYFTSHNRSRSKLYKALSLKIEKKYPYELEIVNKNRFGYIFNFRRKNGLDEIN